MSPFVCLVAGHVILSLDLFKYQPGYHAAMVRAFGGLVIAKDDATAAQLVNQFGVACITLDGKISRPGSMQVSRQKRENDRPSKRMAAKKDMHHENHGNTSV